MISDGIFEYTFEGRKVQSSWEQFLKLQFNRNRDIDSVNNREGGAERNSEEVDVSHDEEEDAAAVEIKRKHNKTLLFVFGFPFFFECDHVFRTENLEEEPIERKGSTLMPLKIT
jgi:hypothetical protein